GPPDINEAGEFGGTAGPGDQTGRAFVWNAGAVRWLRPVLGDTTTVANRINAAGDVVGVSANLSAAGSVVVEHAVVWPAGSEDPLVLDVAAGGGHLYRIARAVHADGGVARHFQTPGGTPPAG